MTSRDRLLQLVEEMPEEQADELLRLATELTDVAAARRARPAWFGVASLDPDMSERHEEVLRAEFGRTA